MNTTGQAPAHIITLKTTLLDFNYFVGIEASILVASNNDFGGIEEDGIPFSAYRTDAPRASQRLRERELLEDATELMKGARKLEDGYTTSADWHKLFRHLMLSRKDDFQYSITQVPRPIAYATNEIWETCFDPSECSPGGCKPDMYFGFPIHAMDEWDTLRLSNNRLPENYSFNLLSRLSKEGLKYTPISKPQKTKKDTKKNPEVCFPWCIMNSVAVTSEHENVGFETFRQTLIAASTALSIFEKLARFAEVREESQHIQPVVTITSAGSDVTVGIAYSEIFNPKLTDHNILTIWNGRITKMWDALQLCRIIDNLFAWSQQTLRHNVSHSIEQWKRRYPGQSSNIPSRPDGNVEVVELVDQIQARLSSLNISPSLDLSDMIQQIVICKEVMKFETRKTSMDAQATPIQQANMQPKSSTSIGFEKEKFSTISWSHTFEIKISGKNTPRLYRPQSSYEKLFDLCAWREHQKFSSPELSNSDKTTPVSTLFSIFTYSDSPPRFRTAIFEPRIKLDPLLKSKLTMKQPATQLEENDRNSAPVYPRKRPFGGQKHESTRVEVQVKESPAQISNLNLPKETTKPANPRVKIPWRGKNIIVRLPPPPSPDSSSTGSQSKK